MVAQAGVGTTPRHLLVPGRGSACGGMTGGGKHGSDADRCEHRRPGPARPGRQPQGDVRVCLDPAGHPFCLFVDA
ncbi:hypothetical protein C1I99_01545 [Micromonospora deserti]|uniref:Glyoxalase-like domain-containing protein n=1 Tax=Micromonospora deserti TaxID=2070366 RepID=A0A2W2CSX6_9ACTN|nr:hypothetical protein C1I99_01545 [Micromonospora deserti]